MPRRVVLPRADIFIRVEQSLIKLFIATELTANFRTPTSGRLFAPLRFASLKSQLDERDSFSKDPKSSREVDSCAT